jgi:hypothetical protein
MKKDEVSAIVGDPKSPSKTCLPLQRFLRANSAWPGRAWVFFVCVQCCCTMQAVPGVVHPDWRWGWDPRICYWIIGIAGAATGCLTAHYRFPGLLAGALAGSGSLLASAFVLERFNTYSRYAHVLMTIIGLLPGVAVYCILHVGIDRLRAKPPRGVDAD